MKHIKSISLICLFLQLTILSFAQTFTDFEINATQKKSLDENLEKYFSYVKSNDFEKMLDMIHPDLVKFMSRDGIIQQSKKALSNPAYTATFSDEKILKIHHAFSDKKTNYVFVDYELKTNFHFIQDKKTSDKDFQLYVDFMESAYTTKFKNAKISKEKHTVIVAEKKTLVASKNQNDEWKFVDYNLDMAPLYEMIFSKELVKKMSSCLE